MNIKSTICDEDGVRVLAGDTVHFSFGIPPISVDAKVVYRDNIFWVLTPHHNPKECMLQDLERHVGQFWVKNGESMKDTPDWYYGKDFFTQAAIRTIMKQPFFRRGKV